MMPQVTSIVDGYFATQVYAVARLDNGWKRHHHIRVERRPFFANENSNHSRIVKATATNNSTSSSVSIFDAMKPNGPAVEKIHGRLAMAMFLPAVAREMSSAETMVQQLQHPDWRLVALSISIFYATMIPVLKDVRDEDFFWMTVRAEKVNGRVAMLAWAIVLTLEWLTEVCFF